MAIVNCKNLSFKYPTGDFYALKDVTFDIQQGDFVLVMGKSASGKSTLLRLMKKEIAPAGEISGSINISAKAGFVPQNVEENIVTDKVRSELSFALSNMGMKSDDIELKVSEVASYFNLSSKLDRNISELSGGEKQMLNLAAVMIMNPDILILDEPVSQLDPVSAEKFISMVKRLNSDFSTTVIIAEHSSKGLFDYADKIMMFEQGSLSFSENPYDSIKILKAKNSDMLDFVPVEMRLFDGVNTIKDCRDAVKQSNIKSLPDGEINDIIAMNVKNISFAYKKGEDVLKSLSLSVYKNSINAVAGPNSSGKSTLLKALSGVVTPYRGKVKAKGRVSMLCQNVYDLFTKDKCSQEVQFGEITDYLEISDIADRHPYDLSGGQAQRLALAKVLEQNSDIILLDEPTKGFDAHLKRQFAVLLKKLCADGKTILIVSHDIEFLGEYADYVSFLSDGRIITTADRRRFFTNLDFYTTTVAKITKSIADNIVSVDDLKQAGGMV